MPKNKDIVDMRSGYSDINGIKMYYEIHGNKGDCLVLIHGGGSTISTSFRGLIPFLKANYKVVALELQGHGHTSDRNAPGNFEQDADDAAALLKSLNILKASFLGFSNGGNAVIQLAVRHTGMINKLVLASTFYKREGIIQGFFEGLRNATLNDMPGLLKDAFMQIQHDEKRLLTMFNKDRERMLKFEDLKDETISSITAPVLIINGDRDIITADHAIKMSRLIKNSRLLILPSSHGSYIGVAESQGYDKDIVELTAKNIINFLNS